MPHRDLDFLESLAKRYGRPKWCRPVFYINIFVLALNLAALLALLTANG